MSASVLSGKSKFLLCVALCAVCCVSALGCSGGGGGGGGGTSGDSSSDETDSGSIKLGLSPETISVDSLAFVSTEFRNILFDDIVANGLTLKLLLPKELVYINGTAALTLNLGARGIAPLYVGPAPKEVVLPLFSQAGVDPVENIDSAENFYFVIFSLPGEIFEDNEEGNLEFNVQVASRPGLPYIFADLDRNALSSFDPAASNFDAEAILKVIIARPPVDDE